MLTFLQAENLQEFDTEFLKMSQPIFTLDPDNVKEVSGRLIEFYQGKVDFTKSGSKIVEVPCDIFLHLDKKYVFYSELGIYFYHKFFKSIRSEHMSRIYNSITELIGNTSIVKSLTTLSQMLRCLC